MTIQIQYSAANPENDMVFRMLEQVVSALLPDSLNMIERMERKPDEAVKESKKSDLPTIIIDGKPLTPLEYHNQKYTVSKWLIEAGIIKALLPRGILFLCVANSARSQIAEGIARQLATADVMIQSAGSHPTHVRPEAVQVLSEAGIDASSQWSKNVSDIDPDTVDTVVTLCAEEECPLFFGQARRIHWELPDPAAVEGNGRLEAFRQVRRELEKRLSVVFGQ